jgi:hypothetical protein
VKRHDAIDADIREWKARIKDIRATEFVEGKDDYKAKLLSNARGHLAMLYALKNSTPPKTDALADAVTKSLGISLRRLGPIDPEILRFAAKHAVKVFHNQKREAVGARHNKAGGSREKAAQLQAVWRDSTKADYATKEQCADVAGAQLGMKFDAALKALQNVVRKKASTRRNLQTD